MTEEELEEFRVAARAELDRLRSDIEFLERDSAPVSPDVSLGRLTRMDAIQNKSVAEANLAASRERKARIEKRLSLLHSPDFERCNNCGGIIPSARILYLLDAETCLACSS